MELFNGIEPTKAEAIKEHFMSLVEAEKNKGIEAKRSVNSEAEGLRTRLRAVETSIVNAGFAIPEIERDGKKVYDYEGLSDVLKKTSEKTSKLPEKDVEISSLRNQISANEKTMKDLGEFKSKWEQETKKARNLKLENELSKAFSDESGNPSIYGKSEVIKNLIYEGMVDLDESEKVIWRIGEDKLDLKTGKEKFLETRKDLIKVTPKGGSGGAGAGGSVVSSSRTDILADIRKMKAGGMTY